MIRIRPSFLSDADTLAPDLRAADRSEIEANSGREPTFALRQSIQYSKECWTVFVDGKIACIFGVGQIGDNGVPWMLGSNLIARHAKTLMYLAPRFIETWKRRWPVLVNWIDSRNKVHIRWLERLGAKWTGRTTRLNDQDVQFREFQLV